MKILILLSFVFVVVYAETQEEFRNDMKAQILKTQNKCVGRIKPGKTVFCMLACTFAQMQLFKHEQIDKDDFHKISERVKKFDSSLGTKLKEAFDECFAKVKPRKCICGFANELADCFETEKGTRGILKDLIAFLKPSE